MRFCCEKFKGYYKILDDETSKRYPAIRILKIIDEPWNTDKIPYSYIILCGFIGEKPSPPIIVISHCPFCGIQLAKFYNQDEYVNDQWSRFK